MTTSKEIRESVKRLFHQDQSQEVLRDMASTSNGKAKLSRWLKNRANYAVRVGIDQTRPSWLHSVF